MRNRGLYKKAIISLFLVLNLLSTQALALSAADVHSANGATVTDLPNGNVQIATDAVDNLKAEVIFNKFSLNNQSLITQFNGLNQILFIGDISGLQSQIRTKSAFADATITASGIGKDTARLVLQNLNGFNFEGGSVKAPSLIVSTIENTLLTSTQANFKNNKNNPSTSNINIRNTDFEVPYGLSLVSAGDIKVNNSSLNSSLGNVQLVTADGVTFKYKNNNEIQTATGIRDNVNKATKIDVKGSSLIAGTQKNVYLNNQAKISGNISLNIANSAVQAPDGTVYFIAENAIDGDKANISYTQNNSSQEIDAKKTIFKTTGKVYTKGTLKTSKDLQITSNKVYLQHANAHILANGKLNLKTDQLQGKSDNTVESVGNLTLTADNMDGTYRLNIKSGNNVKLTLNDQDLSLQSYNSGNNRLDLRYDNKVQNTLYVFNPDNKAVNLNVSENNTIAVNNTINKLSPFVLNAGHITTSNNGTIANNKSVNITAKKNNIVIDSYDTANDILNVNFGSDTLKIQNKTSAIALANSAGNSLTINGTINKNSNFTIKGGEILTQNGGILETKNRNINITSYTQDIAIDSFDQPTNTLNLMFGNNTLALKNNNATTLDASQNNTLSVINLIEKDKAFTLSAGEFDIANNAGITTTKTVRITDKTGDLNLISDNTTGVKRFEDSNNNFSLINTDNLTSKLDPDQLGSGSLYITTNKGNLNAYKTYDRTITKLTAKGKDVNKQNHLVSLFEPAPLPVIAQLVIAAASNQTPPVQPERFFIQPPTRGSGQLNNNNSLNNNSSPLANIFNQNNNNIGFFNFNNFGGASAGLNTANASNNFAGVPCQNSTVNCSGQFEYFEVLAPILY